MASLRSRVDKEGSITIVHFGQEAITAEENEEFKAFFSKLLEAGAQDIVIDMSNTIFISSLTLASLVYVLKKTKDVKGSFALCGVKAKVKEVLEITNLDKVFPIFDDKETAVKKMSSRK